MARLTLTSTATAVGVLALGVAAERAAPSASLALTAADLAVGCVVGVLGAWLVARAPVPALVAIAVAVTWFLGTLAGATNGLLSGVGSVCLFAYRAPVLQLLLGMPAGRIADRRLRVLAVAGWIAALLPSAAARPTTVGAAALVAVALASRSRRAAEDRRGALQAAAGAAAVLAVIWGAAIVATGDGTALLVARRLGGSRERAASRSRPQLGHGPVVQRARSSWSWARVVAQASRSARSSRARSRIQASRCSTAFPTSAGSTSRDALAAVPTTTLSA